MTRLTTLAFTSVAGLALVACTEDPQYVTCPGPTSPGFGGPPCITAIEVGIEGSDVFTGTASMTLPVELETMRDATARAARAAELGVDVPYVRIGDVSVSIEWTIKNLSDAEGEARIDLNGGNEYFRYVPLAFVVDPDEDEEPPPLVGDVPLIVGPGATRSGVFREDQLREASIDLEQVTRGINAGGMPVNPFAAMLTINEDDPGVTIPPMAPPDTVPFADLGQLVVFDLVFEADRHMVLEYNLRVRDHRGILHEDLLDAPPAELTTFAPADFVPVLPPP